MFSGPVGPGTFHHLASSAICESNPCLPVSSSQWSASTQRRCILRLSPTRWEAIPCTHFYGCIEFATESPGFPFAVYPTRNLRGWKSLLHGRPSDPTTRQVYGGGYV
jgi:hypothetical protein